MGDNEKWNNSNSNILTPYVARLFTSYQLFSTSSFEAITQSLQAILLFPLPIEVFVTVGCLIAAIVRTVLATSTSLSEPAKSPSPPTFILL
jgi:hypothetical protein